MKLTLLFLSSIIIFIIQSALGCAPFDDCNSTISSSYKEDSLSSLVVDDDEDFYRLESFSDSLLYLRSSPSSFLMHLHRGLNLLNMESENDISIHANFESFQCSSVAVLNDLIEHFEKLILDDDGDSENDFTICCLELMALPLELAKLEFQFTLQDKKKYRLMRRTFCDRIQMIKNSISLKSGSLFLDSSWSLAVGNAKFWTFSRLAELRDLLIELKDDLDDQQCDLKCSFEEQIFLAHIKLVSAASNENSSFNLPSQKSDLVKKFVEQASLGVAKMALFQYQNPEKLDETIASLNSILEKNWQKKAFHAFIGEFQTNYSKFLQIPVPILIEDCKNMWKFSEKNELIFERMISQIHQRLSQGNLNGFSECFQIYNALFDCLLLFAQSESEESYWINQKLPDLSSNPVTDDGCEMTRGYLWHRLHLITRLFVPDLPIKSLIEEALKKHISDISQSQSPSASWYPKIRQIQEKTKDFEFFFLQILQSEQWKKANYETKMTFHLVIEGICRELKNFNAKVEQFNLKNIENSLIEINLAFYRLFWAVDLLDTMKRIGINSSNLYFNHLIALSDLVHRISKWNLWFE